MGWSYRKTIGSGPFWINFSQSGVSYSVGVKGARINFGSRGTYVNLSAHGISYRKKLNVNSPALEPISQPASLAALSGNAIASADVGQLSDIDSAEFISELTKKASQISYVNWFGIVPLIVFLTVLTFTSFSAKTIIDKPATDSIVVKVTSDIGVNVRQAANARSVILRAAGSDETFPLLDSTDSKWLKVQLLHDSGYISRNFASIVPVHYDIVTRQDIQVSPYAAYVFLLGSAGFSLLIPRLKKIDKKRFEMQLYYDMDEQFCQVYDKFNTHFATFSKSTRVWQYLHSLQTNDFKRNAGAGQLIKRTPVRQVAADRAPLAFFQTNVSIPCIRLSHLEFYFLPERLLIKKGNTFAAVFYKNLQITGAVTRFIEDESLPHDASVVDRTWRYVNKRGGPDRRFNNNRELPVCAYSRYTLTSDTGIYEVLTTSKQGAMDDFAGFLAGIGNLQSKMAIS